MRKRRRKGRERRKGKERREELFSERSEEVKQDSEKRPTKVNRVEGSEREREGRFAREEERVAMATVDAQ